MYYTIYRTTNLIDGKIYIGSHKTKNLDDTYMGSGKYLKRAIEKYGLENFKKEILFVFDNPKDMYAKEAEIVNEDFLAEENTYNLKVGGHGGFDYIIENNLHSSSNMKGVPLSKERKEKQSNALKSLYESGKMDHVRKLHSERMKLECPLLDPEVAKKVSLALTNKPKSNEHKESISNAMKSLFEDDERGSLIKEKMSKSKIGNKNSDIMKTPEYRKMHSEKMKEWWRKRKLQKLLK